MDPTSRAILLCGGGPSGPEYIGTYKFINAKQVFPNNFGASYQWQVPAQTKYIQAFAWGSGAYGTTNNSHSLLCHYFSGYYCGSNGGGGGFSTAVIPVTAGETLYIGVGTLGSQGNVYGYNGANGNGGGFTGIFRGSTPLIIAGGGGGSSGGGGNGGNGGAGGGDPAQDVLSGGGSGGNYLSAGSPDGGGGYYGGAAGPDYANGGTGYVTATGNLYTNTITGSNVTPPEQTHPDYVSGHGTGGTVQIQNYQYNTGWVQGLLVIHALGGGYDPNNNPSTVIPTSRTILGTY